MKSYNSCPAQDMKLAIGDFNAKIGRELFISSNAGLHSLHKETNENGQRLWDFAVSEKTYSSLVQLSHIRKCTNTHGYPLMRENGNYKPDTSKLKEKNILKEYKLTLSAGIISELDSSGNDFNWKSVREIILKSANETVPGLERRTRNEWYDEDCRKATEMKNKAYLQLLQKHCTRTHEEKYRELRKAEKKLLRRKKEIFFENS
ncbi:uncharacterized protein TNCV_2009411 [Trichonephila clavipes]|nr:uncharacterized protein TNCV_2009411 [Trichonephila clavipes]